MDRQHPNALGQFGIRLSDEVMEQVKRIQAFRERVNQPITLIPILEDAISLYYDRLIAEGGINSR